MIYIGIDPGKKGGYAIIYANEFCDYAITCHAFTEKGFIDDIKREELQKDYCRCCLEKVHAMPKQGVSSTFTFGNGYGFLRGVLQTVGISYQEITPQRWKAEFGLNSDKAKSIEVCQRLFPNVNLLPTEKSRKPSDGMAEALLMAEYARRKL